MKKAVTEKQLRKLIREAIKKKLYESVTDKNKVPDQEWVKLSEDIETLVRETLEKAKELISKAEEINNKELESTDSRIINDRKTKEYQLVKNKINFLKNLITRLSSVDFDASEIYYKGKI